MAQARGDDAALVIDNDLLEQRGAERLRHAALDLAAALQRVEHAPGIGRLHALQDADRAADGMNGDAEALHVEGDRARRAVARARSRSECRLHSSRRRLRASYRATSRRHAPSRQRRPSCRCCRRRRCRGRHGRCRRRRAGCGRAACRGSTPPPAGARSRCRCRTRRCRRSACNRRRDRARCARRRNARPAAPC